MLQLPDQFEQTKDRSDDLPSTLRWYDYNIRIISQSKEEDFLKWSKTKNLTSLYRPVFEDKTKGTVIPAIYCSDLIGPNYITGRYSPVCQANERNFSGKFIMLTSSFILDVYVFHYFTFVSPCRRICHFIQG